MKKPDWQAYYNSVKDIPPRPHLVKCLNYLDDAPKAHAIDAGCGIGSDIAFLLNKGFEVTGYDNEAHAIDCCKKRFAGIEKLTLCLDSFDTFSPTRCQVYNASSSLFFCHPNHFDKVWPSIKQSIETNGFFCGNLLGVEDSWMSENRGDLSGFTSEQIAELFEGFTIFSFIELKEWGKTAVGNKKFWHTFTVIARKD